MTSTGIDYCLKKEQNEKKKLRTKSESMKQNSHRATRMEFFIFILN